MCELPAPRIHGTYDLEPLPAGWANARVTFRNRQGAEKSRYEILQLGTSLRHSQEPLAMIAFKCLGLFILINPIYFFFYTTVHLIRLPIVPIVNCSPLAVFKEAWKIVQIPFFYIGMQFAALWGIFRPLEGRAIFGLLESLLHGEKTRREAEQYRKNERPYIELVKGALFEENPETAFFAGFCMQPLGRVDDPHLISVERLPNPSVV